MNGLRSPKTALDRCISLATVSVWLAAVLVCLALPAGRHWVANHPGRLAMLSFAALAAYGMSLGLADGLSGLALGAVVAAIGLGLGIHIFAAVVGGVLWLFGIPGWIVVWAGCVIVVVALFLAMTVMMWIDPLLRRLERV